jgi:hypothetical protein
VIENVDSATLKAKKERSKDGITIKQRNVPRTVITSIGELTYKRTYYKQENGSMIYLTDHIIGIEPFERVAKELCAELVQKAASMSMQKAVNVSKVNVSRQTVNNKVLSMNEAVTEINKAKSTPREIHIFADEDHAHLRPKRSAIVPIVTVTEGIDTTNGKRHRTIEPVHFQGYGMNIHTFVENVIAAIYEKYDMNKVERVIIHADGGKWIKSLGEMLPNAIFVMDGFHLEKYSKKLFSLEGAASYAGVIHKAIKENNFEAFTMYCNSIKRKQDEKGTKRLFELFNYFQNNWDSIVERLNGNYCGSCTEPLVSHVLSERLSRTPLAWSKEGLGKMAMLRIFEENGGKVTAKHIRISKSKSERTKDYYALKNGFEIYNKYADEQIKSTFSRHRDWSIFEKEYVPSGFSSGKVTGTFVLLNAYSRLSSKMFF